MDALFYKVPDDQLKAGGLFVSGGWLKHIQHPEHGLVLAVPASGNYQHLQALGYVPVGVGSTDPNDVAKEVLALPPKVSK